MKNCFPFKIGTTSFIYPASYETNVRRLGGYLDEIELLLFESGPESLPSKSVVRELRVLSETLKVSYNVHLPIDIDPANPDSRVRRKAVEAVRDVIDRTLPLSPSTFTFHLPAGGEAVQAEERKRWQERATDSVRKILQTGIESRQVSIETLMYPFAWAVPVIDEMDLSVCLDFGHLIKEGVDVEATYQTYRKRTTIVHLHGVEGGQDHLPLSRMEPGLLTRLMALLHDFSGVVSLEVFSLSAWMDSMMTFDGAWRDRIR